MSEPHQSYVTHINESCPAFEFPNTNEPCHVHEQVISKTFSLLPCIYIYIYSGRNDSSKGHLDADVTLYMKEPCRTYKCIMSYIQIISSATANIGVARTHKTKSNPHPLPPPFPFFLSGHRFADESYHTIECAVSPGIHMCDMTHSYTYNITHSYMHHDASWMRRDTFIRALWCIYMCPMTQTRDVTNLHMWDDVFMCVVTRRVHDYHIMHSYIWRAAPVYVAWHVCTKKKCTHESCHTDLGHTHESCHTYVGVLCVFHQKHAHTHTHTHINTHTHTHTHTRTHMHIHTQIHTQAHAHAHTHARTCAHTI